jgi:hypothetical protein
MVCPCNIQIAEISRIGFVQVEIYLEKGSVQSTCRGEKYVVRSEASSSLSVEADTFPERAEKAVLAGVK